MDDLEAINSARTRRWFVFSLSRELEAGYELTTRVVRRRNLQVYLAGIIFVVLAFAPFDWAAQVVREGLILRVGIITPLIISSLWMLRRELPIALEGGLAIACVVAVVGSITALGLVAKSPYTEGYLMAAGMIGFAVNLSMPLRIPYAMLLNGGNVSIYCGLSLSGIVPRHFAQTPELAIFFSIVMVFTLRHAVSREQGSKNLYLFQLSERLQTSKLAHLVEELTRVADRDALTEIGNRRFFDKALDRTWGDAKIEGGSLALAMIDIDHFKSFNDQAGHAEGDRCLRAVARALDAAAKLDNGILARYGGEEFTVLIPISRVRRVETCDLSAMAEHLRRAVQSLAIAHPSANLRTSVSVSIGIALAVPGRDGSEPESLLIAADRALYVAKRAGRNRVELAHTGLLSVAC